MSTIRIYLIDPAARVVLGIGVGTLRDLGWWPRRTRCLLIAKPRGGTARTRKEVVS